MVKELLTIRFKQVLRELFAVGIIRLVFLLVIAGLIGVALYVKTAEESISQYISIGFLFLLLIIQLRRVDKIFLKCHFSNYKVLIFSEYAAISVPVLLCLLVHKQCVAIAELLLGLLVVVHADFKPRQKSLNTKLQKLIPSDSFEWKAGLRKQFFFIVPVWTVAALTSFFIGSVPIAIFILGISVFSFFEQGEPYQILLSYELSPKKLLWLKVKRQLQLFSVMTVPLIALFVLFHPNRWYIPVAEYFIFCSVQIYVITTKYAFYIPNTKSPAAQTFGAIGALGSLIPILLPVVWILTIFFYMKSVNNLNFYLDDYNKKSDNIVQC